MIQQLFEVVDTILWFLCCFVIKIFASSMWNCYWSGFQLSSHNFRISWESKYHQGIDTMLVNAWVIDMTIQSCNGTSLTLIVSQKVIKILWAIIMKIIYHDWSVASKVNYAYIVCNVFLDICNWHQRVLFLHHHMYVNGMVCHQYRCKRCYACIGWYIL